MSIIFLQQQFCCWVKRLKIKTMKFLLTLFTFLVLFLSNPLLGQKKSVKKILGKSRKTLKTELAIATDSVEIYKTWTKNCTTDVQEYYDSAAKYKKMWSSMTVKRNLLAAKNDSLRTVIKELTTNIAPTLTSKSGDLIAHSTKLARDTSVMWRGKKLNLTIVDNNTVTEIYGKIEGIRPSSNGVYRVYDIESGQDYNIEFMLLEDSSYKMTKGSPNGHRLTINLSQSIEMLREHFDMSLWGY